MEARRLGRAIERLREAARPTEDNSSDARLLELFVARNDGPAFEELVRRHGPMVLGACRRILGDAH